MSTGFRSRPRRRFRSRRCRASATPSARSTSTRRNAWRAHIEAGGITRLLYGGNAFLYHVTLRRVRSPARLAGRRSRRRAGRFRASGPSFGRAMDQARLLRRHAFPTAMLLPCGDPRDAAGLEAGIREIADAAGMPLILYLKSEDGFGANKDAGLDAVGRLVERRRRRRDQVRGRPRRPAARPVSRRPARARRSPARHQRHGRAAGGRAPARLRAARLHDRLRLHGAGAVQRAVRPRASTSDWAAAEASAPTFMPLEDVRDAWGPARVLHAAVELAGIASTGPIPPFVIALRRRAPRRRRGWRPVAPRSSARSARVSRRTTHARALRSHRWFGVNDLRSFGHRSRTKQMGFSRR